jgi:DNA-binding CsgD family transcriptional regulator
MVDLPERDKIVGRTAELSLLDYLVASVADGRGGLAWVQGEPGAGKSTLIDAALASAAARGCEIFRGAGAELMQPFPLRLMADCLGISVHSADQASARIAGLLRGDPATWETVGPVLAAGEQMLELVDRQCARGPVVLAVEDLQWADKPTLLLWNRLARAVNQIPLLLLGEARPLPRRVELDRLRELVIERDGVLLDLGPLDPASVAELARRLAGGAPGPRLQATLHSAGGNPLYIGEVVEALVLDHLVEVRGETAELTGDGLASPASVKAAIGSRLGFVPAGPRRTLRMAALLGHEFDAGELAIVTKQSVGQLAETLTDAVTGGILSGTGDRLRFRYAIHQVLLEETPAAIRRALHGEIAHLLAEAGSSAESVARHLMMVPDKIDEWALTWLSTTPTAALYAQPQVSAQLLGRAVDVIGAEDPRWELLATRLTEVLSWLARDEQARQMGAAVVQRTTNVALASRMRIHIIRSAGRLNQFGAALPFCLSSPADDGLAPTLHARLGAWSAVTLSCAGRPAEGAAMAEDALGQATASRDPLTIGFARHAAAVCSAPESRPAHIEAALAALDTRPGHDPESMELQMMLLADHLVQLTNLARQEDAATALAQGVSLASRAGSGQSALMFARAAEFCYRHGRWDEALVHLGRIEPEFFDVAQINPYQGLAALIALHRADRGAADVRLAAAVRVLPAALADQPAPASPLTQALALRAEADGDLRRALELMSSWLSAAPGPGPNQRGDDLSYLVRLALDVGDTATAKTAAELARADMAADGAPGRCAAAAFCQALVDDDARGLLTVAAVYQAHGWSLLRASALEEAAVRLAGARDAVGARSALTDAVRIYTDLGAAWNIRRADGRLRAYRIRRGPRSIHRRASTGWAALTPAEMRITRLVGRGLSNPDIASELFLSRRTVQTHVSNIMSKLQLRSRVDIARAVAQSQGSAGGSADPQPAGPARTRALRTAPASGRTEGRS